MHTPGSPAVFWGKWRLECFLWCAVEEPVDLVARLTIGFQPPSCSPQEAAVILREALLENVFSHGRVRAIPQRVLPPEGFCTRFDRLGSVRTVGSDPSLHSPDLCNS
jgi:hypothetical protein